jgi:hypothetical protein
MNSACGVVPFSPINFGTLNLHIVIKIGNPRAIHVADIAMYPRNFSFVPTLAASSDVSR